jgi:Carbohydrate-binding family 9
MTKSYLVRSASPAEADGGNAVWNSADVLQINQFHKRSGSHRPYAYARLLCDDQSLRLRFDVDDDYAVSRATKYQQQVSQDSCVEFFVQPQRSSAYFNFELNCGGTMLLYFIEDPTPTPTGFAKYTPVPEIAASQVIVSHSMPPVVWPESTDPTSWWVICVIPIALFEAYLGPIEIKPGDRWRANFFKCAADSQHPHWASWTEIGEQLNFHQPQYFGDLIFE